MSDLLDGYHDGRIDERDDLPPSLSNRSPLYQFGWLNGRDDRRNSPRAPAEILRRQLEELESADE